MQAELFAPYQGRILVVDDTSANIQAVTAILREHGYQISVATNGRQALSVLERVRPDLILLDVLMPEMDGFEVAALIKQREPTNHVPIIFLTAAGVGRDSRLVASVMPAGPRSRVGAAGSSTGASTQS